MADTLDKTPPDPIAPKQHEAARPDAKERIRIAQLRMKSEEQRHEAKRRIEAAEKLRNERKRREVTETHKQRKDRLTKTEERKRQPMPSHVPGEVKGFHRTALPLTHADRADINRAVAAQISLDNTEMGKGIDEQVDERLANQLEYLADPESSNAKEEFKEARSEALAKFREAAKDAPTPGRGMGD